MSNTLEPVLLALLEGLYHLLYHFYYSLFIRKKIKTRLKQNSSYYNALSSGKRNFERKVWDFIRYNKFVPRHDLKITLSLKTIIASHAIQISFDLPDEAYDYYDRIILYKDYYPSRFTNKYHKAEVNPSLKVIVFSVRAIYESLNREDDGINVLLHEFAHALWLEHKLMGNEYQIFNVHIFAELEQMIERELESSQQNSHFFRKYAFTDKTEFFAVAVENFFERPASFKEHLPELYQILALLLRQDPGTKKIDLPI